MVATSQEVLLIESLSTKSRQRADSRCRRSTAKASRLAMSSGNQMALGSHLGDLLIHFHQVEHASPFSYAGVWICWSRALRRQVTPLKGRV